MRLRTEVRNRLVMLKKPVAAEIPPSDSNNRRWIAAWPVRDRNPLDPSPPPPGAFHIRQVELPADWNMDKAPYDGDFVDIVDEWADSIEDVEAALSKYVDLDLVDAPWKVDDFPL